jgi:hypothetical protein
MITYLNSALNINILSVNTASCIFLGGVTGFIVGSIIKNIWFTDSPVYNYIETPTTDTGVDTFRALSSNIPSPTVHLFTGDELRTIQSVADDLAHFNSSSTINLQTSSKILETWEDGKHTIFYPNYNVTITETVTNATDLINTGRLDQLSNVAWASANGPTCMDSIIQNSANMVASNPQVVDLISLL